MFHRGEWIDGSADRGYALEVIREGLGLQLEYLTAVMNADMGATDGKVDL